MADWLLTKEVRRKGDWSIKRPDVEPSGWYFEFANEFYPDIDDTAMVLLSLLHARASNSRAQEACAKRAVNWLLAMQSKDGGWAAFDVDNNWEPLSYVPFADHDGSYKTNLLLEAAKQAEMNSDAAKKAEYEKQSQVANKRATALAEERRKKEEAAEAAAGSPTP